MVLGRFAILTVVMERSCDVVSMGILGDVQSRERDRLTGEMEGILDL